MAIVLAPPGQAGMPVLPGGQPRGTALILAMVIILILSCVGVMLMTNVRTRAHRAEVSSEDIKSFEAAEAGLDAAIRSLNTGGSGCLGLGFQSTYTGGPMTAAQVLTGGWRGAIKVGANPQDVGCYPNDGVQYSATGYEPPIVASKKDFVREASGTVKYQPRPQASEYDFYQYAINFGDIRYFTFAVAWHTDGIDNDGNNLVDDDAEKDWYSIWSTGFCNPVTPQGKFTTVEAHAARLAANMKIDAALEIQVAPYNK